MIVSFLHAAAAAVRRGWDDQRMIKVMIFIYTCFVSEAGYCDQILLMRAGNVWVSSVPAEMASKRAAATMGNASSTTFPLMRSAYRRGCVAFLEVKSNMPRAAKPKQVICTAIGSAVPS